MTDVPVFNQSSNAMNKKSRLYIYKPPPPPPPQKKKCLVTFSNKPTTRFLFLAKQSHPLTVRRCICQITICCLFDDQSFHVTVTQLWHNWLLNRYHRSCRFDFACSSQDPQHEVTRMDIANAPKSESIWPLFVLHMKDWYGSDVVQYIPRNMHTFFALLFFVVVIHWLIFPYPSGLLHWHCGNLTIAPVPAKQPWWIWINTSCEFIMNDCITTTKQSTTKPYAYFLGYTVRDGC